LGVAEVPLLQMLRSYTMFPNKGYNTNPIFLSRIEDKDGNVLAQFETDTKQVISEADAYTMITLMKGVVQFGTGHSLNGYNIPVQKAGKTGTTNGDADGWFIGYTPELLAGTWVGCDDQFLKIYTGTSGGNEMALPNWGIFMQKVYADKQLPYGKMTQFVIPQALANDPLYSADSLSRAGREGDTDSSKADDNIPDVGNANDPGY
jgi:penicillin-binding protein 1A